MGIANVQLAGPRFEPSRFAWFTHDPARVTAVRADAGDIDLQVDGWLTRFDKWVGVVLSNEVEIGRDITLELTTDGPEGVVHRRDAFITSWDSLYAEAPMTRGRPGGHDDAPSGAASSPEQADTPFRRGLRCLELASIRYSQADEFRRAAWFFWHLDTQTHPALLGARWRDAIWPQPLNHEGGGLPNVGSSTTYRAS